MILRKVFGRKSILIGWWFGMVWMINTFFKVFIPASHRYSIHPFLKISAVAIYFIINFTSVKYLLMLQAPWWRATRLTTRPTPSSALCCPPRLSPQMMMCSSISPAPSPSTMAGTVDETTRGKMSSSTAMAVRTKRAHVFSPKPAR